MANSNKTLAGRINAARQYLLRNVPYKLIFIITGLLATIWFLLRVIPKPSRAGYPCMRAAAPFMSGFVLYILSFTSSFFAFRKAKTMIRQKSYVFAAALVLAGGVAGFGFFILNNQKLALAGNTAVSEPPDGANNPMGQGFGAFPGRVVWAWNKDATNAACTNVPGDAFWDYKNNDTLVIRNMVEESIISLTGAKSFQNAWDGLFRQHNLRKNGVDRGYQEGEAVFIKVNQGTASWLVNTMPEYGWPTSGGMAALTGAHQWKRDNFAATETGPFVVLNLLRHLVNIAGVPQENIYVGDPMSIIFKHNFDVWYKEFPEVKYIDKRSANHKRTRIYEALEPSLFYSDQGKILGNGFKYESLFEVMEEADYMINVACLKPHIRGGVTLGAKNHFGSISRDGAGHLHPSLVSTSNNGLDRSNEGYGKYRVLVDLIGHKYLGGNTMLFVIEGLFGGSDVEIKAPRKWKMSPFNNDWTNSIFMSVDQVAIESVCFDFLRAEYNGVNQPEIHPNWLGVDDYLHQAADPANWPEGLTYKPDGETVLGSMGVHEHWNNPTDMQYSRNLGHDKGIELIKVSGQAVSSPDLAYGIIEGINAYPNPFTDRLTLAFSLSETATVGFRVVDLQGKTVYQSASSDYQTGTHEISWQANTANLIPGIYMINLTGNSAKGNFSESRAIQFTR